MTAPLGPPPWKKGKRAEPVEAESLRQYGGYIVGNVSDLPPALRPKRKEAEVCDSEYDIAGF